MGTHLSSLKSNLQKLSQTKHNSSWDVADLRSTSKPLTLHTTGCSQRPAAFSATDQMPAHTSSESASHSPSSSETDSTTLSLVPSARRSAWERWSRLTERYELMSNTQPVTSSSSARVTRLSSASHERRVSERPSPKSETPESRTDSNLLRPKINAKFCVVFSLTKKRLKSNV